MDKEYGCLDDDADISPTRVSVADYGVCIKISTLEIRYDWGDYCDLDYGRDALDFALEETKRKFPEIEYEGYIAFPWSDVHSGEVEQWAIASEGRQELDAYDFIGEVLNKNFKHAEHGYTSEDTGDVEDYYDDVTPNDIWSELEDSLAGQEACPEDYEEVLDVLFAHTEWIEKDVLQRTVSRLIDMATETDEDYREELLDYVKKLESGEPIEKDDFSDMLPDGYMQALEAVMAANEYEKELVHDGVLPDGPIRRKDQAIFLSEDSYPRISLKASEGDARAIEILEMIKKANE
jgi:hypothetical protein